MCLNDMRAYIGPSTEVKISTDSPTSNLVNPTYVYTGCFGCIPYTTVGKMILKRILLQNNYLLIIVEKLEDKNATEK